MDEKSCRQLLVAVTTKKMEDFIRQSVRDYGKSLKAVGLDGKDAARLLLEAVAEAVAILQKQAEE